MNVPQGGIVAIQGLGGLGHLAVQYSRKMGYRTIALSSSASKKDFAMELGATDYVDGSKEDTNEALQKMGGADLIGKKSWLWYSQKKCTDCCQLLRHQTQRLSVLLLVLAHLWANS
jgi:D-arabinose 1-dehydrogenase-like Zn-dependent alcohol dehydrogenase